MAITRDFGNPFNVVDYTKEVNIIPNTWGTINNLGIFEVEPVAEQVVTFQEVNRDFGLIVDRIRGDRSNVSKDYSRKLHTFAVPHFPLEDAIFPKDIQGKSAYSSLTEAETLDGVRMRKMERIRNSHAVTLEKARAQLLTAGTAYAPSGTVSQNFFTEFGVTQKVVDFTLGTSTSEITAKIEECIAAIQDNAGMIQMSGVVALCSPVFFAKLIAHVNIKDAYKFYSSTQEPLRQRLAAGGSVVAMNREFFHMGVRFIEMRDSYAGTPLIPSGDAVFVPTGTDVFRTYFAPAERFGLVNTLGEQVYMFENAAPNGTMIEIETESNFINAAMKPALIIRAFSSN
jgi:hypothetical protein